MPELIDVVINGGASLFVCAVGIPPRWAVDKLHAAGIPVMKYVHSSLTSHPAYIPRSMVGHPKVLHHPP